LFSLLDNHQQATFLTKRTAYQAMYPYPLLWHQDLQGGICPKADAKHSDEHSSLQPIVKRRQSKILNIESKSQIILDIIIHTHYYKTAKPKQKELFF
jgi:hypothetical protein